MHSTKSDLALPEAQAVVVEAVDDAAATEWNRFVERMPAAELYHDYRWRHMIDGTFGHQSYYLLARDLSGAVRGVLPLVRLRSFLFGDFFVSLPYFNYGGALAETRTVLHALVAEAERIAFSCGSSHVELRHREAVVLDVPRRDDKVTMTLDLPDFEDKLWDSFGAKLRSQIRRPQKEATQVREGGVELLDDFYSVFARNMRDLGTPVYPRRFFKGIAARFPETAKIIVVDLNGKPAAAGFLLAHRSTVEIPWASSLRDANRVGVNMLLYWAALRDAVRRGFRRFDFGRSSKDSGTYRFKKQWGAQPQQLAWHYLQRSGKPLQPLNPDNPKYRAAISLWRRLPLPVANVLGPHLVKNLP